MRTEKQCTGFLTKLWFLVGFWWWGGWFGLNWVWGIYVCSVVECVYQCWQCLWMHMCVYACVCRCEFKHVQGQTTSYVDIPCLLKSMSTFLKQGPTVNLELASSSWLACLGISCSRVCVLGLQAVLIPTGLLHGSQVDELWPSHSMASTSSTQLSSKHTKLAFLRREATSTQAALGRREHLERPDLPPHTNSRHMLLSFPQMIFMLKKKNFTKINNF